MFWWWSTSRWLAFLSFISLLWHFPCPSTLEYLKLFFFFGDGCRLSLTLRLPSSYIFKCILPVADQAKRLLFSCFPYTCLKVYETSFSRLQLVSHNNTNITSIAATLYFIELNPNILTHTSTTCPLDHSNSLIPVLKGKSTPRNGFTGAERIKLETALQKREQITLMLSIKAQLCNKYWSRGILRTQEHNLIFYSVRVEIHFVLSKIT